ncbi:Cytosolic iron-sulfur protein assembly protein [Saxophila tyrrhenica]|uniref:Probable cytosolic iron-sulfur protein assembly protein 1 n=1 Tax=Saxophila tyrrhenica TaxID=1690608 RepID=A0AAV9PC37_9PEZI|nr:Cytosolic iron-sulfur protein assembly protein [Saxophila tyrrhenica]
MPSITSLATFTPSCNARAWLTSPHPHLPIVATACSDKTVRIYSTQNFQQQSTISGGHKRSIRSCAWRPNSVGESVLATGSFDASAGIWRRWEDGAGKGKANAEIDFTSGLAGGDADKDDEDEDEWKFAVILDGHDSEIKSLAFSPTSPLLATCSRDKSVWIWEELDEDNFETVAVLQDHEGDVKCVAWHPGEELLASASYDDNVRLWREDVDDWACCTLLTGHGGTVWWVEFEGTEMVAKIGGGDVASEEQKALVQQREKAGSRLVSCSDDQSIRVWRKVPKENPDGTPQQRLPSIWKNSNFEEEWVEEARLPSVHERPVLAVSWSRKTGRVASTGSDGKIAVYEERWTGSAANGDVAMGDAPSSDGSAHNGSDAEKQAITEWVVLAEIDNAHDVFEVNHVVWAPRADKGKVHDEEEVLISTGDDGEVRLSIRTQRRWAKQIAHESKTNSASLLAKEVVDSMCKKRRRPYRTADQKAKDNTQSTTKGNRTVLLAQTGWR